MTVSSPAPRRRLPLRFSLRLLLLAVTAFAIGFPVWYRWPYEEEDAELAAERRANPQITWQRCFTWQRQWGGGRKKHGPERRLNDGKLQSVTTWRDGVKHGPHLAYGPAGQLMGSGEYVDGKSSGTWLHFDFQGREVARADFRDGRLWRLRTIARDGIERQIEFNADLKPWRIVFNGRELEDRLARLAKNGQIDNSNVATQVGKPTDMEFFDTPLKDAVDFISAMHEIPIRLDSAHVDVNQPITETWKGIPLSTALTLLTATRDLACDYRYGSVWITSADDAKDWRDPTGVADIVPPSDSQLAQAWSEPVSFAAKGEPLADAIDKQLVVRLGIAVDVSRVAPSAHGDPLHLVTFDAKGQPFRHVLGMLLYQTRCRCKLDGETLVILPPDSP